MPTTTFKKGDWVSICDRCGKKFHASQLKKDWQGLYLCKDDWETRQPQDFLRGVKDDPSVAWTRPEQPDTFIFNNTVNLALNSEDFTASSYYSDAAVAVNTDTAPDGALSADTITDNEVSITSVAQDIINIDSSEYHCLSAYIKKDSTPRGTRFPALYLRYYAQTGVHINYLRVDTMTGESSLRKQSANFVLDSGVLSDGDYWRCYMIVKTELVSPASTGRAQVLLAPAWGASIGWATGLTATGSITVWGLQLTKSDKLLDYIGTKNTSIRDSVPISTFSGAL